MSLLSKLKLPIFSMLDLLDLRSLYSLRRGGPLFEDGWFRSYREQASIDATGLPLPWLTYPAIAFLLKRIRPEMSVFEYGSGGSTRWWASRVCDVVSVEHDRTWFEKVRKDQQAHVKAYQIDLNYGGEYSRKIREFENRFDVVVIDGRDRVNCLKNCLQALKLSGVVILDNSNRPEYSEGVEFLLLNGFKRLEFVGPCPIVNYKSETSIFYRKENVFGI
jgi:hypothetical protein